jgi:hypothetical protein
MQRFRVNIEKNFGDSSEKKGRIDFVPEGLLFVLNVLDYVGNIAINCFAEFVADITIISYYLILIITVNSMINYAGSF